MRGCSVQRWSLSLGQWAGIRVRVHIFFLLFAVLALAFTLPNAMVVEGLVLVGIATASVLLHELAHALSAIRVGGKVDMIILGPVGGLVSPRVPDEPEVQLFVALVGPIVHLGVVVLSAVGLALAGNENILGLLHPLIPAVDGDNVSPWLMAGRVALWLNWVLMLLNLLPAYPFDGGPIFRSMLWPALGRRTARVVTGRAGMIVAVLIVAAAWLPYQQPELDSFTRVQLPLVMLGIFLFFSARQDLVSGGSEELFDDDAGYRVRGDGLDLLGPPAFDEEEGDAVLVEHQQRQGELQDDRRAEEAYEDARVDDILARLHDSNLSELSHEELEILRRASERYKHRLHSHGDA